MQKKNLITALILFAFVVGLFTLVLMSKMA
jgi:hypothetical protein